MAHARRAESEFLARLLVTAFNAQAQVVLDLKWVDQWEIFHRHWGWQAERRRQVICGSLFMFKLELNGRCAEARVTPLLQIML